MTQCSFISLFFIYLPRNIHGPPSPSPRSAVLRVTGVRLKQWRVFKLRCSCLLSPVMSTHSTPVRRQTYAGARTSRPSIGLINSSYHGPSPSAMPPMVPFDWDAARGLKPPPFSTPEDKRIRKVAKFGTPMGSTPGRKLSGTPRVQRVGFVERYVRHTNQAQTIAL